MNRPIIDYIVSGQRIDYQCENVPTNQYYWFWAYNNSFSDGNSIYDTEDHSQYGTGETVKYCMRDNNNPGGNACWLDSGLKANRELSFTQTLDYMADTAWDWSVMPRIRIDSAYAAGTAHNEDTVCRIKITGWKGEVVKDIGLLVENFKQSFQGTYHGNYLDTFHFYTGQDSLFLFKNSITQYFLPPDKGYCFNWGNDTCKMDIKIYWSGKCDTWFDRVRVENEPAHQYLTKKDSILTSKINSEVDWSMQNYNGIPNYFYYEEEQFSHFSAIKELNRQIMERSQNRNSLIIYLNYGLFKAHVPNCWETLWNANDKKVFGTDKMQGIKISI